jgi:hypothetical protein
MGTIDPKRIVLCKGCGMEIFFQDGIPLYAKKVPINMDGNSFTQRGYVSHFVNCPKASEFTRKDKRKP